MASPFAPKLPVLPRPTPLALALTVILVFALGLRLYGVNWDDGSSHSLHPDERSVVWTAQQLSLDSLKSPLELFDVQKSSLVPRPPGATSGHGVYDYGSLPFYLLGAVEWLVNAVPGVEDANMYDLTIIGRVISALFDTGTVLVVFLIARRLFNERAGLLAALFTAFAVLHIQLAHFYTTEAMLTFFSCLSFFFVVRLSEGGRRRDAALAGAFFGLALASKFSAAPMLAGFAVGVGLLALRNDARVDTLIPTSDAFKPALRKMGIAAAFGALTFAVAQPYAILDLPYYAADAYQQSQMVRRVIDFPYTRQYDGSLPFAYHIWQFSVWGVGLPLAALMWAGLGFTGLRAAFKRTRTDILLLAWFLPFFLITGLAEVKFLRYLLPVTPFLAIMAASLSDKGLTRLRALRPSRNFLYGGGVAGLGLVVFAAVFYSFAYANVYTDDHPATRASDYVREHIPPDSVLAMEHWEESLPNLHSYRRITLQLYDPDDVPIQYTDHEGFTVFGSKAEHLADALANADYVIFFSNRLYGSIPTLPDRYPLSSRYYRLLFAGDLGFEVDYVAEAHPNFLGVTFLHDTFSRPGLDAPAALGAGRISGLTLNLGHADDSFTNYEHPTPIILKKVRPLEEGAIRTLLETPLAGESVRAPPIPGIPERGMLSEESAARQQAGGTFSDLFDRGSFANRFPTFVWYIAVQVIALAALPIGLLLFRRLPDRGYLLTKVLGLLFVGYLAWLLASLRILDFSPGGLWLMILVVGAVSGLVAWRGRVGVVDFFRRRWRLILFCEALFLVAFLSFYGVRAWNPDLWHPWRGGEKPMDFAYLNAVTRSTEMPPYDPWFAGGHLNYYYFGQFQIASITKITGVLPSTAFNLAIALIFALTVGGAFSIVYNLAASRGGGGDRAPPSIPGGPYLAGITGAVFVAVIGNLDGAVQMGQAVWRFTFGEGAVGQFDFWRSSRVIDTSAQGGLDYCGGCEITEFPFFSFLFADLHAHLIALPFAILALGLGLALLMGAEKTCSTKAWAARIAALALTAGGLFTINSWDYPTYLLFSVGVVVLAALIFTMGRVSGRTLVLAGTGVVGVWLLGILLFAPFHLSYEGSVGFPFVERHDFATPLYQYLAIHGIFLFLAISYLLYRLWQEYPVKSVGKTPIALLTQALRSRKFWPVAGAVILLAIVAGFGYHTAAFALLVLIMAGLVAVKTLAKREEGSGPELFALLMLGMALALGIGVEFLKVNLVDPGRMNTVFKFYFHAWTLMALASAFFAWRLGAMAILRQFTVRRAAWTGALVILIAAGLVYPIAATPERSKHRFENSPITIDGMAYMPTAVYYDDADRSGSIEPPEILELGWDYHAILWLQDNIEGSPVVLEGNSGLYTWGSRVSVYTGLPTVVGWDWHQQQQRWEDRDQVSVRRADVHALYSTTDVENARRLIEKYGVRYVYVGQLERLYYPQAGLEKFERMTQDGLLSPVYPTPDSPNPEVRIYRVLF